MLSLGALAAQVALEALWAGLTLKALLSLRALFAHETPLSLGSSVPFGPHRAHEARIALGPRWAAVALGADGTLVPWDPLGAHASGVALGSRLAPDALRPPGAGRAGQPPRSRLPLAAWVAFQAPGALGPALSLGSLRPLGPLDALGSLGALH